MVKIFSPAASGSNLGQALADLGKQMFGNTAASELNKEKLYAAQRENTETDNLMAQVSKGGAHTVGSDPNTHGMIIGSGYSPADFAKLGLMGSATEYGARDQRTQNWQVGAGQSYDNTAGAFDAKLAETARNNNMQSADRRYGVDQSIGQQRYEFDNTPMSALDELGKTVFARRGDLTTGGYTPILSETEQKGTLLGQNFDNLSALDPMQRQVLGANPSEGSKTPRNYRGPDGNNYVTYDGVTHAATGAPLPAGGYLASVEGSAADTGLTNAITTDLQSDTIANRKFNFLIDQGLDLTSDPTLFGAQGFARTLGQELMAGAQGVTQIFAPGQEGNEALRTAQDDIRAAGLTNILPELYDPNLPKVSTIWGLLVYSGASALAGQENRSVSDADVQNMKAILGSPQSLFSSAEMMKSKLETARQIVGQFDAISREALGGNAPVAPAAPISPEGNANGVPWKVVQ